MFKSLKQKLKGLRTATEEELEEIMESENIQEDGRSELESDGTSTGITEELPEPLPEKDKEPEIPLSVIISRTNLVVANETLPAPA